MAKANKVYIVQYMDDVFPTKIVAEDIPDALHKSIELLRNQNRVTNIQSITECKLTA